MIAHRRGVATLLAALLLLALVPSTARAQTPIPPALTLEALKNGTYPVDAFLTEGVATLTNGHFERPAAPGSASKATVDLWDATIGTIGGRPGAAVILSSSGGGSGLFFAIYAVDASGKTVARDALGDRIKVQSLSINAAGRIVIDLLVHGPNEPMTSATLPEHREYALAGTTLTRVAATPAPAPTGSAGLEAARHTNVMFEVVLLAVVILGVASARRASRGFGS